MPICKDCAYFNYDVADPLYGTCTADAFISETTGESRYSIPAQRIDAKQECTKPEKFVPRKQMERRERLWKSH